MTMGCNAPFWPETNFPPHGGGEFNNQSEYMAYVDMELTTNTDVLRRFCVDLTKEGSTTSCCLPCPLTHWVYSDSFPQQTRIANYVSIMSLICNTFLLLTFLIIPQENSHRHYLSTGLTVSLNAIAVAFIIPLGTDPDFCYNAITPNNLHTDLSCAFTGVLVEAGAMGAVVWSE